MSSLTFRSQVVFGAWLVASQPKTKFVIFWKLVYSRLDVSGCVRGPDWARTSDPALIKRML